MSFVCDDHEFSCRINDEASICTADLLAIEAAIEYIWDSNDEEFMMITDSLSLLQALKSQKGGGRVSPPRGPPWATS